MCTSLSSLILILSALPKATWRGSCGSRRRQYHCWPTWSSVKWRATCLSAAWAGVRPFCVRTQVLCYYKPCIHLQVHARAPTPPDTPITNVFNGAQVSSARPPYLNSHAPLPDSVPCRANCHIFVCSLSFCLLWQHTKSITQQHT